MLSQWWISILKMVQYTDLFRARDVTSRNNGHLQVRHVTKFYNFKIQFVT